MMSARCLKTKLAACLGAKEEQKQLIRMNLEKFSFIFFHVKIHKQLIVSSKRPNFQFKLKIFPISYRATSWPLSNGT